MGVLTFTGMPDDVAAHLKSQWKLAPGEVYDASYVDDFLRMIIARDESLQRALAGKRVKVGSNVKPDRQSSTVNVTFIVK
jgi:hypothetical protein